MVLCIGVSEIDRTYTWADLPVKHLPPCVIEYRIARDKSQEMDREFCRKVDQWIANGQYEEMDDFWEQCKRAEIHALQLHERMNNVLYAS